MNIFVLQSKPKRTALINDKDDILRVFASQTEAAVCTDTDQSAISKVCRGLKKSVKGKKFIIINNETYKSLKEEWQE